MTDKPKIAVDIWSDVMCPWCAIGYTQFAKSVSEVAGEIDVAIRWMPFELNPDAPVEGKDQARHLAEVYSRTPEEIAAMRSQMQETAERAGFPMAYTGEGDAPPQMIWNTFEAHKLLRWALADQGTEAQTRLEVALFKAHFQQRRNVSDREVLLDIAAAEGFDRAKAAAALDDEALGIATRYEEERGRQAGINSVPSFVVNGKYLILGAREQADFSKMLRQVAGLVQAA
ncbi:DsbA family oxidoreductase [Altererythrobacter sp. Root672]|uniref:DsbA family oxidoreductase n=1 Tax=Altererythrobacter sp. Root672 TaxID=1736584 RepID=UPI0006FADC8D|nr:DsbA family oxidoreductase [Altererythrobacter sp. Root672]KRA82903.1 2-hydroxychromene-2-carboxylate isomerase [Altererythrobacter sp. Root672]